MTRKKFLDAIIKSEIAQDTPAQVLKTLFQRAGYYTTKDEGISEKAFESWIDGERRCRPLKYFPEGKISDPRDIYYYFRRREEKKLAKLQEIFRKENDSSSPIDCTTKDLDRFCWSLVNQFSDLFGLERLDFPASDRTQENIGGMVEVEVSRSAGAGQNSDVASKNLRCAEKGSSLEDVDRLPEDHNKNVINSDIIPANNYRKKPEWVSFAETPTEQMREIFEKAVEYYNIAVYMCRLPDYLSGEAFYGSDIYAFNDVIENKILSGFLCEQNEEIYKMISEFKKELRNFAGFLSMLHSSVSEAYGFMWTVGVPCDEIIRQIDSDYNETQDSLEEKSSIGKIKESPEYFALESKLNQLNFIRSILMSHKQISELFEEICLGKTICVF